MKAGPFQCYHRSPGSAASTVLQSSQISTEEWGFLGASLIVILFTIFLLRILVLAERQRSVFCRIFGYSVFAIFLFHFVVNIGMTIGLLPVIGIPLPFMSYGGSSLWAFTILLFVFLRLDISRLEYFI